MSTGNLFGGVGETIVQKVASILDGLNDLPLEEKVGAINAIKLELNKRSPFAAEPVDCVLWVPSDDVHANDYNPNAVAPPEMKLLELSIAQDGYTQPIVTFPEDDATYQVVDGFHRNRVGKESKSVRKRIHGYLPITMIRDDRSGLNDRIASTIRHNRARGKHQVEAMSEIVAALTKRGWDNKRISRELGMEDDEVLRLKQITGLAELFAGQEFSEAWEIGNE